MFIKYMKNMMDNRYNNSKMKKYIHYKYMCRFWAALFVMLILGSLTGCGNAEYIRTGETDILKQKNAVSSDEKTNSSMSIDTSELETDSPEISLSNINDTDIDYRADNINLEEANDEELTELNKYRLMYENGDITLGELDNKRAELRRSVANQYESNILDEYQDIYSYNNRVVGYIHIDNTVIDGPVLQTLEDYEYYLHRDIDGIESEPGCIILDADSESGIGTKQTGYYFEYEPSPIMLVHGHNMRNGTMFGSLLKYENKDYGLNHNMILFDSLYEKREYELVSAFYSQIYPEEEDVFKYYDIEGINTSQKAYDWYKNIENIALYKTGAEITEEDELIVLSTCSYHVEEGRFAIVGKRIK